MTSGFRIKNDMDNLLEYDYFFERIDHDTKYNISHFFSDNVIKRMQHGKFKIMTTYQIINIQDYEMIDSDTSDSDSNRDTSDSDTSSES